MQKGFYIFCSLVICLSIFSCNNNEEQTVAPVRNDSLRLAELKQSVVKYPDSLLLVQKLIEYYRNNGDYDSAIAMTDNLIKKNPNIAELWDMKATLHYENDDTLKAINAFERAINIIPRPEYLISLGTLYAQTKNAKALTFTNVLKPDRTKAKDAFFIEGLYYNYTGNKRKAIALFDSSLKLDYAYMFAYREKAIALYDEGKYEEALKVLTRAVTVQNNFDEGYYWMGNCYKKLNKKEEAIQSYHTALLYDKDFIEAKDSLKTLEGK
jgi:tetratricopeptide (TPR) repeat protein